MQDFPQEGEKMLPCLHQSVQMGRVIRLKSTVWIKIYL